MSAPTTIAQLVTRVADCTVGPIFGRQQIMILLRDIELSGQGHFYVTVSADQIPVHKTKDTSSGKWNYAKPIRFSAYPSSNLKFTLRSSKDELLGEVQASLWTLLSNNGTVYRIESEKVNHLTMQVNMAVDDGAQNSAKAKIVALRGDYLLVPAGHASDHLEEILHSLEALAKAFPLCKIAIAFLNAVQKGFRTHREVDASITRMLSDLRGVVVNAFRRWSGDAIPNVKEILKEVVHLAGRSAEILDGWLSSRNAHVGQKDVCERIRRCQGKLDLLVSSTVEVPLRELPRASVGAESNTSGISLSEAQSHTLARPGHEPMPRSERIPCAPRSYIAFTHSIMATRVPRSFLPANPPTYDPAEGASVPAPPYPGAQGTAVYLAEEAEDLESPHTPLPVYELEHQVDQIVDSDVSASHEIDDIAATRITPFYLDSPKSSASV